MMDFFYRYITAPKAALTEYQSPPKYAALLVLALASVSMVQLLSPFVVLELFLQGVFLAGVLIVETIVVDFIAQLFGKKAQSLRTFTWFAVGLLPSLMSVPIAVISQSAPMSGVLLTFCMMIWVIYLKFLTLRVLYKVSLGKAILIYLFPFLLLVGFFLVMIVSVVGVSLASLSLG